MKTINIKPLSVNKAWQGKRFKTPKYKAYELESLLKLPKMSVPDGKLIIVLEWGLSYSGSDFDNPVKPFTDILQKKYGFNDSKIYDAWIKKRIVKKGQEYIKYDLLPADKFKIEIKEMV